jgi:hypothetical protein
MVIGSSGTLNQAEKNGIPFSLPKKTVWVNSNLGRMVSGRTQRKKARARNKLEKSSRYALLHVARAKSVPNV